MTSRQFGDRWHTLAFEILEQRLSLSTMYDYSAIRVDAAAGYTLGQVWDYGKNGAVLIDAVSAGSSPVSTLAVWANADQGPASIGVLDPFGALWDNPAIDEDGRVLATGWFNVTDKFHAPGGLGGLAEWDEDRWREGSAAGPAKPSRVLVADNTAPNAASVAPGRSGGAGTFRWTVNWTDDSRVKRGMLDGDDLILVSNPGTPQARSYTVTVASILDYVSPIRDASKVSVVYEATVPVDPGTGRPFSDYYSLRTVKEKVEDIAGNPVAEQQIWGGRLVDVSGSWSAPTIKTTTDAPDLPELAAVRAGTPVAGNGPVTNRRGVAGFGAFTPGDARSREPALVIASGGRGTVVALRDLAEKSIDRFDHTTKLLSDGSLLAAFAADGKVVWRQFQGKGWMSAGTTLSIAGGSSVFAPEFLSPSITSITPGGEAINFYAIRSGSMPTAAPSMLRPGVGEPLAFESNAAMLLSITPGYDGNLSEVGPDGEYAAVQDAAEVSDSRSGVTLTRVDVNATSESGGVAAGLPEFVAEVGQSLRSRSAAILDGPLADLDNPRVGARVAHIADGAAPWRVAFNVRTEAGTKYIVVAVPIGQRPVLFIPGIFGCFPTGSKFSTFITTFGMPPADFEMDPLMHTYDDLLRTLENHGYVRGQTLFPVGYDWRLPIMPEQEIGGGDEANLGFARSLDGVISNLTAARMTDGVYDLGTDYLGYYLGEARRAFELTTQRELDAVDIIAHSTGGLLARAYIQSPAYGTLGAEGALPKVNLFTQIAVPNRGASKGWNVSRDNWNSDLAYQIFLSTLTKKAYDAVMVKGKTMEGERGTLVTKANVERLAAQSPRYTNGDLMAADPLMRKEAAFLDLYCPTVRTLTSTFAFLQTSGEPDDFNPIYQTINEDLYLRNGMLLDLNNGLDADYTLGSPESYFRDSSPFTSLSHTRVIAGRLLTGEDGNSTPLYATRMFGPRPISRDDDTGAIRYAHDIYQMSSTLGRIPRADEVWFLETKGPGDGTVPYQSAQGQFFAGYSKAPVFTFEGGDSSWRRPTDHGGLNHNRNVMEIVARIVGQPVDKDRISEDLATSITWELIKDVIKVWADPIEAVVVDAVGRRLGWTAATGPLTEIPGSRYLGAADGIGLIIGPVQGPLKLIATGLGGDHVVQITGRADGREIAPVESSGFLAVGSWVSKEIVLGTANEFIGMFNQRADKSGDRQGFVRGDWIADSLKEHVSEVAYGAGYWGGENYWFQDSAGDVWNLWHGGPVHADPGPEFAGQHDWLLTNLTDAAGLSGQLHLVPGSISGIATGWNAFNIQGVADGKLWALWWSPVSGAGEYVDTDGSIKQGQSLGIRGNGWVLSSISDSLMPVTEGAILPGSLLGFTQSQGNGRTSFDPRPNRYIANDGMSIIVVDNSDRVYVASFSIAQDDIPGARPDLNAKWLIETLADAPSLTRLTLAVPQIAEFEQQFIMAARE